MGNDLVCDGEGSLPGRESSFYVWLHPRRSLRCLDALRRQLSEIRETETDLRLRLDDAENAISCLEQENKDLSDRVSVAENARVRLEARLMQMQSEEEYQREMDAKIAEIETELAKSVEMKRKYEAKIRSLSSKLHDANDELKRLAGYRTDRIDLCAKAQDYVNGQSEDDIITASHPADSRGKTITRHTGNTTSLRQPLPADDNDWLQPLPDNI